MKCPSCGYKLRSTMKRRKPKYKRVGEHEYLIDARDKVNRRMEQGLMAIGANFQAIHKEIKKKRKKR